MRLKVQAYGPSKSARALADFLEVKRLLTNGNSRFRGRAGDIIVNWGNPKQVHNTATYLNPLDAVRVASNKLSTFKALKEAGVSIPVFFTNKEDLGPRTKYMARTTLTGHSGQGIVVGKPSELPEAPLYSKLVKKTAEYRAIVVNGKVVDFKQKLKRRAQSEENPDGHVGEHDEFVWNLDGGYIFARNGIRHPEEADIQSIKALEALNLKYGAVDLIEDANGKIYVLEINTAFGLEGTTVSLVGNAIKEIVNEVSGQEYFDLTEESSDVQN